MVTCYYGVCHMKDRTKCIIIGSLAGAANGLFGAGGGLFVVPLFIGWLHMDQRKAFATSLGVILPLTIVSLVVYGLRGGLDFMTAIPYLIGGLAGGFIGGKLFHKIPLIWLRRLFGLLILYGGVKAVLLL